jgi:hypothetical protein
VRLANATSKRIAEIRVGDFVLATDPKTGIAGARQVIAVATSTGAKDLVQIVTGSVLLTATANHRFWVESRGDWVTAADLRAGDTLRTADGTLVAISHTRRYKLELETVYNLEVADLHTFHAGDNAVIVHNGECKAFGSGRPPHTAQVTVTRNGKTVVNERLASGGMTPDEAALGFPLSALATHTEARAVRRFPLEPGDVMVIRGKYPPCPPCKGKMNQAAISQNASIRYEWPDGVWVAGKR